MDTNANFKRNVSIRTSGCTPDIIFAEYRFDDVYITSVEYRVDYDPAALGKDVHDWVANNIKPTKRRISV